MNATGPDSPLVVTGLTGGLVVKHLSNPPVPVQAQDLGYPSVTDFVFNLNYLNRGISNSLNSFFHSTSEFAEAIIRTGFWNPDPMVEKNIGGYLIINGSVYSPAYSTISANDAILLGEYIIQNQVFELFVVDKTGFLEDKYTNYNYNIDLLSYLIVNPYRIIHSGNIQFLNSPENPGGPSGITFINTTGSSGSNPVVYSRQYLISLGPSSYTPYPVYEVYISVLSGMLTVGATATFESIGLTGNDPVTAGNFFVAQNNLNGFGFVTILNNAIGSSLIPGGTSSVEFISGSYFNCDYSSGPTSGSFDPNNYNGVALLIKDKNLINQVSITDNSQSLGLSYSPPIQIAPFMAPNPGPITETCSGMFSTPILPSPQYNFLKFGGSINYP
jgi:hypothetical protein